MLPRQLGLSFGWRTDRPRGGTLTGALVNRKARRVTCPTLVLAGDCDFWLGLGLLRGIEDVVNSPQVHVLRGASHWIQQDKCARSPCRVIGAA